MPDQYTGVDDALFGPEAVRRRHLAYHRRAVLDRITYVRKVVAEVFYICSFVVVFAALACFLAAGLVGLL